MALGDSVVSILIRAIDDASGTIARVSEETKTMGNSVSAAGTHAASAASKFSTMAVGVGALTAGVAAFSVKAAVDFEDHLQKIQGNTGMSNAQLAQMRQEVLKLGSEGPAPLASIATGFEHAANQGYHGADAMRVVTAAWKGAIATGGDVGETVNVLSTVMRNFHEPTTAAATDMGILMAAAQNGNVHLPDLVSNFSKVGVIASSIHMPLADAASVYSELTRATGNAAQSQTLMVGMLTHMISPTKAATTEMESLRQTTGVDLVSAFQRFAAGQESFTSVMQDVRKATHGNAAELMTLFGGLRGGVGALKLLNSGWQDYLAISQKVHSGGQQLNTQFGNMQKTLGAQLGTLRNNIQEIGIAVGSTLVPSLDSMTKAIIPAAAGIERFAAAHPQVVHGALAAGAAIGGLGVAMKIATTFGGPLVGATRLLGTGLLALGPYGILAAVGLTAAGVGSYYLYNHSKTAHDMIDSLGGTIKMWAQNLGLIPAASNHVAQSQDQLTQALLNHNNTLGDAIRLTGQHISAATQASGTMTAWQRAVLNATHTGYDYNAAIYQTRTALATMAEQQRGPFVQATLAAQAATRQSTEQIKQQYSAMKASVLNDLIHQTDESKRQWDEQKIASIQASEQQQLGVVQHQAAQAQQSIIQATIQKDGVIQANLEQRTRVIQTGQEAEAQVVTHYQGQAQQVIAASMAQHQGVVTEAAQQKADHLEQVGQETAQVIEEHKNQALSVLATARAQRADLLKERLGEASDAIGQAQRTSSEVVKAYNSLGVGVNGKVENMKAMVHTTMTGMATDMNTASNQAAQRVIDNITRMQDQVVGHSIVPDMHHSVTREMQAMATEMEAAAAKAKAGVVAQMTEMEAKVVSLLTEMAARAGQMGTQIVQHMTEMSTQSDQRVTQMGQDMISRLEDTSVKARQTVTDMRDRIGSELESMSTHGQQVVSDMGSHVSDQIVQMGQKAQTAAVNAGHMVTQALTQMATQGEQATASMAQQIESTFAQLATQMQASGRRGGNGFTTALRAQAGPAQAAASEIKSVVVAELDSIQGMAQAAGAASGAAFAAGLASQSGAVTAAASSLAAAAAGALERHSPPPLAPWFDTNKFGVGNALAFADGLKLGVPAVTAGAQVLATAVTTTLDHLETRIGQFMTKLKDAAAQASKLGAGGNAGGQLGSGGAEIEAYRQLADSMKKLPPDFAQAANQILASYRQQINTLNADYIAKLKAENASEATKLSAENKRHEQALENLHKKYVESVNNYLAKQKITLDFANQQAMLAAQFSAQKHQQVLDKFQQQLSDLSGKNIAQRATALQHQIDAENQNYARYLDKLAATLDLHTAKQKAMLAEWLAQHKQALGDAISKENQSHDRHVAGIKDAHTKHVKSLTDAFSTHVKKLEAAMKAASSPAGLWDALQKQVDKIAQTSLKALDEAIVTGKGNIDKLTASAAKAAEAQQKMTDAAQKAADKVAVATGDFSKAIQDQATKLNTTLTQAQDKYAYDLIHHTGDLQADAAAIEKAQQKLDTFTAAVNQSKTVVQQSGEQAAAAMRQQQDAAKAAAATLILVAAKAGDFSTAISTTTQQLQGNLQQALDRYAYDLANHTGDLLADARAIKDANLALTKFDANITAANAVLAKSAADTAAAAAATGDYTTAVNTLKNDLQTKLQAALDRYAYDLQNHTGDLQADAQALRAAQVAVDDFNAKLTVASNIAASVSQSFATLQSAATTQAATALDLVAQKMYDLSHGIDDNLPPLSQLEQAAAAAATQANDLATAATNAKNAVDQMTSATMGAYDAQVKAAQAAYDAAVASYENAVSAGASADALQQLYNAAVQAGIALKTLTDIPSQIQSAISIAMTPPASASTGSSAPSNGTLPGTSYANTGPYPDTSTTAQAQTQTAALAAQTAATQAQTTATQAQTSATDAQLKAQQDANALLQQQLKAQQDANVLMQHQLDALGYQRDQLLELVRLSNMGLDRIGVGSQNTLDFLNQHNMGAGALANP